MIDRFLVMLAEGKDSALLRFSLGSEYLKRGDAVAAEAHLARAVDLNPAYSAAWKLLGKARSANGDVVAARDAYERGIAAANAGGDKQAAKEMGVFLKRLSASD